MTAPQMISALRIIENDLNKSNSNKEVINPEYVLVRYNTIKDILLLIECNGPDIKKEHIEDIIKLEYIKAYSSYNYLPRSDYNMNRYKFIKSLIKLFNIKL